MLQIIFCSNCKKTHGIKPNIVFPFEFTWIHKAKRCKECGNVEEESKTYQFCCEKCLKEFMNKFIGHKCKWVDRFPLMKVEKGIMYEQVCTICGLTRFVKK